ncbi:MAG: LysR substrate-binding domain-containing protein, partial [Myxococcota bacterium]
MEDWNELAIFVKVVQEGSFIEASRSLGVPRSTVSRKIASLEDRLGVRLLQRTTRSVQPTDEGRAYYERCSPLIREAAEAARAVGSRQDVPTGRLRITAPSVLGHHFLGPIVSDFLAQWSDVRVELLLTDRVVNLVEEGYDLAVRVGKLPDSNLIARRLGESQIRVVASSAYLQRYGEPSTSSDLSDHRCIVVGENAGPYHWTFRHRGD